MTELSLRERHAVETRQRIVDVALALFVEQGFDATTIDQIASSADVSPRTYFRYFPTKEALIFHDFDQRLAGIRECIEVRPEGETPLETLTVVLCAMIDELRTVPEQKALTLSLLAERPSVRSYQRSAVIDHAQEEIVETLAHKTGKPATDPVLKATLALVTSCMEIALRDWVDNDLETEFESHFRAVLDACRHALDTQEEN